MIRFALIVASTLGFVLTAALGNLMTPLLRAFRVQQEENEPPTMGGLCLMVGTLAAVGVGWTAACVAQPELLGTESLLTTRLLIALFGALCFGAVGLADDVVRLRHRSPPQQRFQPCSRPVPHKPRPQPIPREHRPWQFRLAPGLHPSPYWKACDGRMRRGRCQ